jgi:hypothetical protein
MKKLKLYFLHKRIAIQLALLIPIVIITGIDLLYLSILILSVLSFHGIVTLYGNDPFLKSCAAKSPDLKYEQFKPGVNPLDPYNIYLGHNTLAGRQWAFGF